MNILETQLNHPTVRDVRVGEHNLQVTLLDGRVLFVPLVWFPRLAAGQPSERSNWRLISEGEGIHWPDVDEDISLESILAGRKSRETAASLQAWMNERSVRRLPARAPLAPHLGTTSDNVAEAQKSSWHDLTSRVFALAGQPGGQMLTLCVASPLGGSESPTPQSPVGSEIQLTFWLSPTSAQQLTRHDTWDRAAKLRPRNARKKRSLGSSRELAA